MSADGKRDVRARTDAIATVWANPAGNATQLDLADIRAFVAASADLPDTATVRVIVTTEHRQDAGPFILRRIDAEHGAALADRIVPVAIAGDQAADEK